MNDPVQILAAPAVIASPAPPITSTVLAVVGIVLIVMAGFQAITNLARGEMFRGFFSLLIGGAVGTLLIFSNILLGAVNTFLWWVTGSEGPAPEVSDGSSSGDSGLNGSSQNAPTPEPPPAPETPSAPVDIPWGVLGAIAAGLLVISIVVLLFWYFGGKIRNSHQVHKQKREDLAARQKDLDAKWSEKTALHKALDEEWHSYEASLESILANPLMRNLSDPSVAEAVRAMGEARNLQQDRAPRLRLDDTSLKGQDYLAAVDAYAHALKAAQQKSEMRGIEDFPKADRDDIETARRLLAMALNEASTEAERQSAYDRVVKIVKKLKKVSVPKEALKRVEITAGVTSRLAIEAPAGLFEKE